MRKDRIKKVETNCRGVEDEEERCKTCEWPDNADFSERQKDRDEEEMRLSEVHAILMMFGWRKKTVLRAIHQSSLCF